MVCFFIFVFFYDKSKTQLCIRNQREILWRTNGLNLLKDKLSEKSYFRKDKLSKNLFLGQLSIVELLGEAGDLEKKTNYLFGISLKFCVEQVV